MECPIDWTKSALYCRWSKLDQEEVFTTRSRRFCEIDQSAQSRDLNWEVVKIESPVPLYTRITTLCKRIWCRNVKTLTCDVLFERRSSSNTYAEYSQRIER